jgi:anti-sigma-K factor RskA
VTRPDVTDYVLGEMGPARASAFERAMAEDPALREEADSLRRAAVRLERLPAEAWDPADPPPLVLPATAPRPAPRGRLVLRPAFAALAAAALLAAGVALGALLDRDGAPGAPAPAPVARETLPLRPFGEGGASARGQVVLSGRDGDRATVRVSGLPPASSDEFYELWLLGDDGLVALGSFQVGPDGTATLEVPLPVDPAGYEAFDVSVEPGDGDPTHSGRSVLRGPAARS